MYKTISYSQDFLGNEDMQVMHCYPENYLLFILDPTASFSAISFLFETFLTFYPKHQNISSQIIIVGTSRKRPRPVIFLLFLSLDAWSGLSVRYMYYAIQSTLKTLCDNTSELN